MVKGQSYTMTASTIGKVVAGRDGEKAETVHVLPESSKTKQFLPRTAMLAWESSSVLEK
jgi:hypothetical protein